MVYYRANQKGFSLVEVIFVAAISTLVFGSLFASFQYTLKLVNNSRAKLSALSVANDRLEYIRSLPYDDVGTVAGIPSGTIPQNSTTTLNGIEFAERILIEYVDDEADGTNVSDTNGIPSDYKRVKLEYIWEISGATSSVAIISNIVPRSIESTTGGGTVRVNVIDENSASLPGASVQLINNTTTSTINVTKITDASGSALFSGAPAASNYELIVTANISGHDYSIAKTYQATTTNPNPIVSPFTVVEADISTLTFQIGELSDLDIKTFSAITEGSLVEDFTDLLSVASSTDVDINAGKLVLADVAGVYKTSGVVYLGPINPATLLAWGKVRVAPYVPANTNHKVQFFTSSSTSFILIPDSDLANNSVGFTDTLFDLSSLEATTYNNIYVGITLNTTDTSITPNINEVGVYYREAETVLPNIAFDIRGDKFIGTNASSSPIYKYSDSLTTNGSGNKNIPDLEFDNYTVTAPAAYDIAKACTTNPVVLRAGIDGSLEMVLVTNAVNTLRVTVVNNVGETIPGVNVNLTRPGYNVTEITDNCGQAFFTGGVSINNDYAIAVDLTGYVSESVTAYEIDGDDTLTITLDE